VVIDEAGRQCDEREDDVNWRQINEWEALDWNRAYRADET